MVKLHDVSYTYMSGGPFEKTAVKGINLELKRGEFVGLIGHTGSGKSTLVQLIAGLTKPTAGTIEVDGKTLFKKGTDMRKLRFGIGLVMQYPEYQLFEETVFKDIAFGPSNMGLSSEEITRRVHFAADLVGIRREILEKSPFELSGGQKRRVAVAGVLAMEPKLLILDEPAAGLDPAGRDEILHKIRDMHRRLGITVVLVSHSMEDIAGLADRIVVMNKGTVAMTGKPVEVFKSAEELKKMGLSVPQITEVCNRLREAGVPIPDGLYTVESAKAELEKLLKNEMR
ncbi:MAG: energy-coupling factor transporter ATPase [Ruminococcaceae bacterium]|nr:energy-coupling factor transporter ATPase [Oscillospiraceae bacterium]